MDFEFKTKMSRTDAVAALRELSAKRSVPLAVVGSGFDLHSGPIPLWFQAGDRRRYSRDNWVGLNPFLYFPSISFKVTAVADSETQVLMSASLSRVWLQGGSIALAFSLIGIAQPQVILGGFLLASVYVGFAGKVVAELATRAEVSKALRAP